MRQSSRSGSAPSSRPQSPARASGISMRQSSGSALPRHPLRMLPTSNEPGFRTATTLPKPSVAWLPSSSAAQGACDDQVLDLVRAFTDLENLRVAVEASDRRLEHVAEAAVDLDGL